jgi:hypothetical protein
MTIRGVAAALLATGVAGCGDGIEGEWVYPDVAGDLFLDVRFVAAPDGDGEGDVLYDIAHVPNVEMQVGWQLLEDGRYRVDFRCLDVPDDPDLACESLSFWLACTLDEDRLQCDFVDCAECGTFRFDRVPP